MSATTAHQFRATTGTVHTVTAVREYGAGHPAATALACGSRIGAGRTVTGERVTCKRCLKRSPAAPVAAPEAMFASAVRTGDVIVTADGERHTVTDVQHYVTAFVGRTVDLWSDTGRRWNGIYASTTLQVIRFQTREH